MIMKKMLLLPLMLILFTATACGNKSASNTSSSSQSSASTEVSASSEDSEQPTGVAVGETASVGNMSYRVFKQYHGKTAGDYEANGEYLVLSIGARNDESEAVTVDTTAFKIYDAGDKYSANSTVTLAMNQNTDGTIDHSFLLESLNPNETMYGYVAFDVPKSVVESDTKQLLVTNTFGDYKSGLLNLE